MKEYKQLDFEKLDTYKLIVPDGLKPELAVWAAKLISESGSMLPKTKEDMLAMFESGRSVILVDRYGEPVAHGAITFVFEKEKAIEIGGIIVSPDMRGKGYGKQIVEAVIDLARLRYPEYTRIALCNDLSLPIFLSVGAEVVSFDGLGIDATEVLSECASCPRYKSAKQEGRVCCDTPVVIS